MKIVIEDYPYTTAQSKEILARIAPYEQEGAIRLGLVGYHYSQALADTVFFLPKVVVDEKGYVFGREDTKLTPDKLLDLNKAMEEGVISDEDYGFIYGLSVWIYRAISEFRRQTRDNKHGSKIVLSKTVPTEGLAGEYVSNTHLDIMLSLIRFNTEHQDFVTFVLKNIHSGAAKANWAKTIRQGGALVQRGAPVYADIVSKRKQIDYDEELFVIFFSILQHLHDKYGFPVSVRIGYELLSEDEMEACLGGLGVLRLERIRYKYFSDKELLLWQLCHDFFAMQGNMPSQDRQDDYLLVKNFDIVFEAMIDKLLSDDHDKVIDRLDLREQPDGKRVDHIYAYDGLIYNEVEGDVGQIYYIGDSKYYKIGHKPGREAVFKQFTYARNVIQANLDLFNDKRGEPGKDYLIYRDNATEGYNITPNFFISADLPRDGRGKVTFDYADRFLHPLPERDYKPNTHFPNRLFDRDTLLLQHYNVNFLYILATYGSGDGAEQLSFRKYAQDTFRSSIMAKLQREYQFFSLQLKPDAAMPPADDEDDRRDDMDRLVDWKYFRKLLGKAFRPFAGTKFLYLSLEGKEQYYEENMKLLTQLSADFLIRSYRLGTNPSDEINHFAHLVYGAGAAGKDESNVFRFADFASEVFLIGGYRPEKNQREWILAKKKYNVRLNVLRRGGIQVDEDAVSAKFLVLYDISDPSHSHYHVYLLNGKFSPMDEGQMRAEGYRNPTSTYFVYGIDKEVFFEQALLQQMLNCGVVDAMSQMPHDEAWRLNGVPGVAERKGHPVYLSGKAIAERALPSSTVPNRAIVVVDIGDKDLSGMADGYAAGMFVAPTMKEEFERFASAAYVVHTNKKAHKVFRVVGPPVVSAAAPRGYKVRKYGVPLRSVATKEDIEKRTPDFHLCFRLEPAAGIHLEQSALNKAPDGLSGYDTRVIDIGG